jgi:hypothetical protein
MEGGRKEGREEGGSAARRESVPETSVQEGKTGGEESMMGIEGNANGEASAREDGEVSGGEEGSKIAFGSFLITLRREEGTSGKRWRNERNDISGKDFFRLPYSTHGVSVALHKFQDTLLVDGALHEVYSTEAKPREKAGGNDPVDDARA